MNDEPIIGSKTNEIVLVMVANIVVYWNLGVWVRVRLAIIASLRDTSKKNIDEKRKQK